MTTKKTIELSHVLDASPHEVFSAIRDGMLLMSTGIKPASFEHDFKVGGAYSMEWNVGGFCTGRYLKIVPDQMVSFTWKSVDHESATITDTNVTVTLVELNGQTELKLVHSGLDEGRPYDGHLEGWKWSLDQLGTHLKRTASTREFPLRQHLV